MDPNTHPVRDVHTTTPRHSRTEIIIPIQAAPAFPTTTIPRTLPGIWTGPDILPPSWQKQVKSWLSQSELARYRRLAPALQSRYLASRGLSRLALSAHYRTPLSCWQLEERKSAPPVVENTEHKPYISISHSGGQIAVGLAEEPLGVDLEKHRRVHHRQRIANRLFTPDQQRQLAEAPELGTFMALWTQKEARHKAHTQLGAPIPFFTTEAPPDSVRATSWQLNLPDTHGGEATFSLSLATPTHAIGEPPTVWHTRWTCDTSIIRLIPDLLNTRIRNHHPGLEFASDKLVAK